MSDSIFSKWWFWLIAIFVLLSIFTPLGILFKNVLSSTNCNTWTIDTSKTAFGGNSANDCPRENWVCVPKNKEESGCFTDNRGLGCGQAFLAEGHTINNPAHGICKPSVAGAFP